MATIVEQNIREVEAELRQGGVASGEGFSFSQRNRQSTETQDKRPENK